MRPARTIIGTEDIASPHGLPGPIKIPYWPCFHFATIGRLVLVKEYTLLKSIIAARQFIEQEIINKGFFIKVFSITDLRICKVITIECRFKTVHIRRDIRFLRFRYLVRFWKLIHKMYIKIRMIDRGIIGLKTGLRTPIILLQDISTGQLIAFNILRS